MRTVDVFGYALGALVLGTAIVGTTSLNLECKKRITRNRLAALEPNAADAYYLGGNFINVNRDNVPGKECYFKDPVTGIEYVVTRDSTTRVMTFTPFDARR